MYQFQWPTRTVYGAGLSEQIGEYLRPHGESSCLLLVAPGEAWVGEVLDRLESSLKSADWRRLERFNEIEPNPSWQTVSRGRDRLLAAKADAVLAVGGGSTMDAAKIIAQAGGIHELCMVPTTAGTGSEISPWAVVTNLEHREKESVIARWPDLALLDPLLTLTMPPRTTLFSGIDAFIHGLEAYCSNDSNPITDALSLAGMRLAKANLPRVMEDPQDLQARGNMLQASLLTGAAMMHAGLGLMHAIGNVVGGLEHNLPHGLILAQCMDVVLEFNRPSIGSRLPAIEDLLEELRVEIQSRIEQMQIGRAKVSKADLELLVERAVVNVNAKTNPRTAGKPDIRQLVGRAFEVRD
ncbi:MAG: iron-containing alcohol dehydrogenase [Anaerolineales bacterium]|jgi:alcohol dehydrogenase